MNVRLGFALCLTVLTAGACGSSPASKAPDQNLSWLSGCWITESRRSVEYWRIDDDTGLPAGSGFQRNSDGNYRLTETVLIERARQDGALIYTASPVGQMTTSFFGTPDPDNHITFSNAEHDYPQIIRYSRIEDKLIATISLVDGSSAHNFNYEICSQDVEANFRLL